MSTPLLLGIDHIHVFISDREAATAWYDRVLGLRVDERYVSWATGGGPLTVADATDAVHLALFERPAAQGDNRVTVALRTSGVGFAAWRAHLQATLPQPPKFEDHALSQSLYFADPWGNPFEITTYDVE